MYWLSSQEVRSVWVQTFRLTLDEQHLVGIYDEATRMHPKIYPEIHQAYTILSRRFLKQLVSVSCYVICS